jgi:PAS domain S-box-containing protein
MDSIVELDQDLKIIQSNPAARKLLAHDEQPIIGREIRSFFTEACWNLLARFFAQLRNTEQDESSYWIPESLYIQYGEGEVIPVEASLSRYEMDGKLYFTLILRSILEREKAEEIINSLLAETRQLREELADLEGMGEMLGQSKPMQAMFNQISQVAHTDATVLIQGETGTGKELVAREIHHASPRAAKPLVKVNCAAIPSTLMESEFFGHEKGAFTGATSRREGRFAMADGGTIFLDEIGELSLELQVKLLRVLQEGEFEPVGSSKTINVDVRVVAATNRDLQAEVRKGNFREDLYYRLNVFPVNVPPLKYRGADIALLAEAFARRIATKIGREILPLNLREKTLLQSYDWPGNVRELHNIIERAVILSQNGRLGLKQALPESGAIPDIADGSAEDEKILTDKQVRSFERENIVRALQITNWKIAGPDGAADLLGLPPTTLSSRIKSLGIHRKNM